MNRPSIPQTPRWGIGLAFGTAAISGVAVWLNSSALRSVGDPAVYTTLKNLVAAVVHVAIAGAMGHRAEVRRLDRGRWGRLMVIGVIGGAVPFLLFFTGLSMATAPGAAFIHKTLFLWVALMAVPLLGERIGVIQVTALGILLVGQTLLVMPSAGGAFGVGEVMILAATLLWSIEVIVAKRVLVDVSPTVVGAARLGFGLVVLGGYLVVTGKLALLTTLTPQAGAWVLLTGLLLAGYVGTWFAALSRAPATVVTAVLVVGALGTAALDGVAGSRLPEPATLLGGSVMAVAVVVIALAAQRADGRAVMATESAGRATGVTRNRS